MPRSPWMMRALLVGLGLCAGGCDPGHKGATRTSKPTETSWSDPVVKQASQDEFKSDPEAEKTGVFGGKRLQGGLDDTSRDIERSLGVR